MNGYKRVGRFLFYWVFFGVILALVDLFFLSGSLLILLFGGLPSLAFELVRAPHSHWLLGQLIACAINLALIGALHVRLTRFMRHNHATFIALVVLIVTGLPSLLLAWSKMSVH